MNEELYFSELKKLQNELPAFADGRIDYSNASRAMVVNIFVQYQDTILLLKRSDKVRAYQGLWNSIGGYLDEVCPLYEKVLEELREELGISDQLIQNHKVAEPYEVFDKKINIQWIIYPVLVILHTKPEIKLDWEHTEYIWLQPTEMQQYQRVPGIEAVWQCLQK